MPADFVTLDIDLTHPDAPERHRVMTMWSHDPGLLDAVCDGSWLTDAWHAHLRDYFGWRVAGADLGRSIAAELFALVLTVTVGEEEPVEVVVSTSTLAELAHGFD